MASNKQKVVAPKQSGCRVGRPHKSQPATPAPAPALEPPAANLRIKLNLKKPSNHEDSLPPVSAYQFPLSSPLLDDAPEMQDAGEPTPNTNRQGTRRGARQRTKTHVPDMVFGSEMDNLITSSATIGKTEDEDELPMVSSPPAIINMRAPLRCNSPNTIRDPNFPPSAYADLVSQNVYDILNTLQSTSEIHVDLPNMWDTKGTVKPYTSIFLTQLYIQCYENQLWHFCDLIADTWIRALQEANRRSHKSKDVRDHMWRKNKPLGRMFAEKKKGFKTDVYDFGLDVQDPEVNLLDVTRFSPERLRELYTHTRPKCGARLLWADAMALCGRKMENDIVKQSDVWPKELFFDMMCTSLRLVGRKLTLKIEEKYEGAWCRYHEHVKHGLPCYRQLAWQQKGEQEEVDGEGAGAATGMKRSVKALVGNADEQGDTKRVRFEGGGPGGVIDFGDIDAEGDSEEGG